MAPAINKPLNLKYVIDCSAPVKDNVLDIAAFEKFLHDRLKVNGRTGNLGTNVSFSRADGRIVLSSKIPVSKRTLKYLSKKFLKKNNLRDWLRVVASNKQSYELRYFNISQDDDEDDEE
ncbi:60S ribosomal protein L22 [Entomophthora muscae]|uniref:60S ribosomal protein L22 n=2 Tax=Entomophthora muscae TaxID=34485 RepID=A0ACC2T1H1_9FUNG|nr:60S ribosomal protein L22 [Entomophthora muscae]KAJ9072967.1 60S ribosomal protein L22 [Entomophthora muscae]